MKYWLVAGLIGFLFVTISVYGDNQNHRHDHGHKHKHDHNDNHNHSHNHDHDEERRQLSAHRHGSGNFNIAIEGHKVSMELESPGADIVGFEYKATTDKQKAAVASAQTRLKDIANVVGLPGAAGCKLESSTVKLNIESGDKKTSHSEFHSEYVMTCSAPHKLVEITFPYFKNFKGAQELEVSVAGPKSQKKFEVERDVAKVNIGGAV